MGRLLLLEDQPGVGEMLELGLYYTYLTTYFIQGRIDTAGPVVVVFIEVRGGGRVLGVAGAAGGGGEGLVDGCWVAGGKAESSGCKLVQGLAGTKTL